MKAHVCGKGKFFFLLLLLLMSTDVMAIGKDFEVWQFFFFRSHFIIIRRLQSVIA